MTTAGEGSTPTALDLLFGPDADAAETLAGEVLPSGGQKLGGALAHLSEMNRKAAVQNAADTVAALLKVDLTAVLARGWREHRDVVSAARRTLAAPGSTELVSMPAHEVTLDQRPSVSVLVDGKRVATLELGLSIVFDVSDLLLGISGGQLVAVHSGQADVTATLTIEGANVLTRQARLELPGVVQLGAGIRLLAAGDYPVGAGQAESTDDDHAQLLASAWEDSVKVGVRAYRPPGTDFDDDDDDEEEEDHRRGQAG